MLAVETRHLRLPRSVYRRMIRHAASALPSEAVGLLAGASDGRVTKAVVLPNSLGRWCFLADPYAQFTALRQLAAEGQVPLAVYHSHPGGGVGLSAHDVRFASALPWLQVVIALARRDNPAVEAAAYAVTVAGVEEAVLELVED